MEAESVVSKQTKQIEKGGVFVSLVAPTSNSI